MTNEEMLTEALNTLMWADGYLMRTTNLSLKETIFYAIPYLIFDFFEVTNIDFVYGDTWVMIGMTPRFPMLNSGGNGETGRL